MCHASFHDGRTSHPCEFGRDKPRQMRRRTSALSPTKFSILGFATQENKQRLKQDKKSQKNSRIALLALSEWHIPPTAHERVDPHLLERFRNSHGFPKREYSQGKECDWKQANEVGVVHMVGGGFIDQEGEHGIVKTSGIIRRTRHETRMGYSSMLPCSSLVVHPRDALRT
jgi:hypothetical protein